MHNRMLIAIDGVCASGKSSLAHNLAEHYNLPYLNTGKIYRFLAFNFLKKINLINTEKHNTNTLHNPISEIEKLTKEEIENQLVELASQINLNEINDKKIESEINKEIYGQYASKFACIAQVRHTLVKIQREFAFANHQGAILDGRDIGSVILPEAEFKIFVTADLETRAIRRMYQLQQSSNTNNIIFNRQQLDDLKQNIKNRDKQDTEREHAPLQIAHDAFLLDNTELDSKQTTNEAISFIETKKTIINANKKLTNNKNLVNEMPENFNYKNIDHDHLN